ncbi:hypothetical protein [Chlamydia psittaci]|uniref:hypothetical protein n=1 Tax=Chlamydia psittaci TaxID=83554 RepID=UPI0001F36C92|nr:hypothetical protein [Chlamydia psittaci]AFS19620.1 hypothetical protein B595_0656 [Chlamydia psittaci 84/55]AFS22809.1 hypothetical protein B600_0654 [Chlamydia psittaci VS225]EPJ15388.1 hypothetical protein CP02DC18_1032 [Chlamydia psittaci 02DC18]EPJ16611.1 hypothetical protein CP02DC22_1028 [Chlamydia psittaci 02DC22]EPJ19490.1 hypothetical protein CP02DC21_1005 [Chlamydia psittaci 02DC21]EPJ20598.1 hypothetical protein CP02DC23_0297 [Chlamydia psittaci 02DC23]EPJ22888.1 hypothetical 
MINTAIGIIGIAALASALDEYESSLNQNDTPQRPGEYTVSSSNDAVFLLRDIEKLTEVIHTLHFTLPSWLINDIKDIENGAKRVLEVSQMHGNDNRTGLGVLQGLFDNYYQVRDYLNSVCYIGDGTNCGTSLGNIKYYGSATHVPHTIKQHPFKATYPSPIQGKARLMTISAIAILSILALAAVVALGTLGGLSIIALPISIGVSVATALGFVLTTAILIKKLKSRVVTEYRQEIIPVSQYPRPIYWGCSNFN